MGNPYPARWEDAGGSPIKLAGQVTFTDASNQPGGGSSSNIPTADPTGVSINTTTYSNPVTGSGKLTTLVFPQDTAAFAIAISGDAFPRIICTSDGTDGLYFGDGTIDPYNNGASIFYVTAGGEVRIGVPSAVVRAGSSGVVLDAGAPGTRLTVSSTGTGFFGTAPVSQPAHPTTLADVIAALVALGLVHA